MRFTAILNNSETFVANSNGSEAKVDGVAVIKLEAFKISLKLADYSEDITFSSCSVEAAEAVLSQLVMRFYHILKGIVFGIRKCEDFGGLASSRLLETFENIGEYGNL